VTLADLHDRELWVTEEATFSDRVGFTVASARGTPVCMTFLGHIRATLNEEPLLLV
jgi:hypothetical protein